MALVLKTPSLWGSSPLSRGIQTCATFYKRGGRIIPALAGNTRAPNSCVPILWDHPRSRGEYLGFAKVDLSQ